MILFLQKVGVKELISRLKVAPIARHEKVEVVHSPLVTRQSWININWGMTAAMMTLGLINSAPAVAFTTLKEQVTHPFAGATYTHQQATSYQGQPLNINVVQIDLTQPGLQFQVTPPKPDGTTPLQTTLDYTSSRGAQIGINGNFFLPSRSDTAMVQGLAASNGSVYSSWTNGSQAGVNIAADNTVTYIAPASVPGITTSPRLTPHNLLSGFPLITNGKVRTDILDPRSRTARTAIGFNAQRKQLVLLVVDGPASGVSNGMTQVEVANLLLNDYDVFSAVLLDGGGSSTLVFCQTDCQFVNVPSSKSRGIGDRVVGNNLAIFMGHPTAVPVAPQFMSIVLFGVIQLWRRLCQADSRAKQSKS